MQPADTALTRVYNQPTVVDADGKLRGALYKNPIDCLWKTFKAEGIRGWYKGSTAHFMRIAPHTCVSHSLHPHTHLQSLQDHHANDERCYLETVQGSQVWPP